MVIVPDRELHPVEAPLPQLQQQRSNCFQLEALSRLANSARTRRTTRGHLPSTILSLLAHPQAAGFIHLAQIGHYPLPRTAPTAPSGRTPPAPNKHAVRSPASGISAAGRYCNPKDGHAVFKRVGLHCTLPTGANYFPAQNSFLGENQLPADRAKYGKKPDGLTVGHGSN